MGGGYGWRGGGVKGATRYGGNKSRGQRYSWFVVGWGGAGARHNWVSDQDKVSERLRLARRLALAHASTLRDGESGDPGITVSPSAERVESEAGNAKTSSKNYNHIN